MKEFQTNSTNPPHFTIISCHAQEDVNNLGEVPNAEKSEHMDSTNTYEEHERVEQIEDVELSDKEDEEGTTIPYNNMPWQFVCTLLKPLIILRILKMMKTYITIL